MDSLCRNKKRRANDPNKDLRVAKDCAPAHYVSKKQKSSANDDGQRKNNSADFDNSPNYLNNRRRINKTKKSQEESDHSSSSDSDDENDYAEEDEDEYSEDSSEDDEDNEEEDNNEDDHHNDSSNINYNTDDEKVDENNYYHKRMNVNVRSYGSTLPYIGKVFQFVNSDSRGTVAAVVCKVGDPSNELYYKFYDHKTHLKCPDAYKTSDGNNDDSQMKYWQYIKCNELMGSKKTIEWEGGNPGKVGDSLVGMYVRRPFKIGREWQWFNGQIDKYLKGNVYEVHYEDGDVVKEKESDVVKYLMYTF